MQSIINLREIRKAWRRRWVAVIVAFSVCGVGWPLVLLIPDQYESMARVYFNTQTMLKPVLRGLAVDSDVRSEVVEATRRTLLSRPNLEQILRGTDMDLEALTRKQKEVLLKSLRDNIKISGGRRNGIYIMSYVDKDPVLAQKVVEKLLDLFVETALGTVRKDLTMTEDFIDEQILGYEARLAEAEVRLKEFKRENIGFMPTEAGGYFQRLNKAITEMEGVQLEFNEVQKRRDMLSSQIEGEIPFINEAIEPTAEVSMLDARIGSLQIKLDDLLLQYTESHPDVVAVLLSIKQLEEKKKLDLIVESEGGNLTRSPIYQQLKVEFAKTEADLSALRARKIARQEKVHELRGFIDKILKSETQLAQLNRDYQINKKNYETFVIRRESAKISRDADQSADSVQFKVIDPPIVPLSPVFPNRPLFISIVLVMGVGAGLGLAWLVTRIRPSFDDPNEAGQMLNLPVLGSISCLYTDVEKKRRNIELVSFASCTLILFIFYSGIIVAQKLNINLLRYVT